MNVSLPDSLRNFVDAQVRDRGYNSASEFVRELIRDARERATRQAELKEMVQLGLEQLRNGESLEFDDATLAEFFEQVKTRARKRLPRKKARKR